MMVSRHRHLRANRREGRRKGRRNITGVVKQKKGGGERWREGGREGACVMGGCVCLNRRKQARERNMYR